MDDRSTVSPAAVPTIERVQADQVVFTSVRSATAEGYRIIAASSGVTPEEKAEITRRAPSHGSLCEAEPEARALSAYPLGSGRHCVALSQYAGVEHTARGGLRVHTYMAVLNPQAYVASDCSAVRVFTALDDMIGGTPVLEPPRQLEPLSLPVVCPDPGKATEEQPPDDVELPVADVEQQAVHAAHVQSISQGILSGEELIVTGSRDWFDLLEHVIESLPVDARQFLAVSAGLNYSPSRRLQLSIVACESDELRKAVRGRKVRVVDINRLVPDSGR